jgi:hypothetical protein
VVSEKRVSPRSCRIIDELPRKDMALFRNEMLETEPDPHNRPLTTDNCLLTTDH